MEHTDHDGPDIDEDEESHVGKFLKREEEGEDMIGDALRKAVYRVERMAGEGSGHDPLVVRFVEVLVDAGMV